MKDEHAPLSRRALLRSAAGSLGLAALVGAAGAAPAVAGITGEKLKVAELKPLTGFPPPDPVPHGLVGVAPAYGTGHGFRQHHKAGLTSLREFCWPTLGHPVPELLDLYDGQRGPYDWFGVEHYRATASPWLAPGGGSSLLTAYLMAYSFYLAVVGPESIIPGTDKLGIQMYDSLDLVHVSANADLAQQVGAKYADHALRPWLTPQISRVISGCSAEFHARRADGPQVRLMFVSAKEGAKLVEGYNVLAWALDRPYQFHDREGHFVGLEFLDVLQSSMSTRFGIGRGFRMLTHYEPPRHCSPDVV